MDGSETRGQDEHLELNEDTLWSGRRMNMLNPNAGEAVPKIRKLLFDSGGTNAVKIGEAEELAQQDMVGIPTAMPSYSTLGDLYLRDARAGPVSHYLRELDLDTGVVTVSYELGGVHYRREVFASAPDHAIVMRLTADRPASMSLTASMDRPADFSAHTNGNDRLVLTEGPAHLDQIRFRAEVLIRPEGGRLRAENVAQARLPITEKIEWTWTDRPETPVADLPNVLLVGDSITRAYYPAVATDLKGVVNVYLFATSACGGDPRLPGQIRDYFSMMSVHFAVVHFNIGMHGWGYFEQQYAAGLPDMIAALRAGASDAKLIWTSTTPVLHDSATGGATNSRIDLRNRLASELMSRDGIPIDDQHELMFRHQDLHDGDVHFTAAGSALQAEQVAAIVRAALGKTSSSQPGGAQP